MYRISDDSLIQRNKKVLVAPQPFYSFELVNCLKSYTIYIIQHCKKNLHFFIRGLFFQEGPTKCVFHDIVYSNIYQGWEAIPRKKFCFYLNIFQRGSNMNPNCTRHLNKIALFLAKCLVGVKKGRGGGTMGNDMMQIKLLKLLTLLLLVQLS